MRSVVSLLVRLRCILGVFPGQAWLLSGQDLGESVFDVLARIHVIQVASGDDGIPDRRDSRRFNGSRAVMHLSSNDNVPFILPMSMREQLFFIVGIPGRDNQF